MPIVREMLPYICMASARQTANPTHRLTPRQREIAAFVERGLAQGRAPSRADIAAQFGITRATAQQHVVALERLGVLRRLPGARGLAVARQDPAPPPDRVPVIGRVAAGRPLLAVEDAADDLLVPEGLFRECPDLMLRVEGDSMIGAGILDGDLIAIVLRKTAEPGQLVVARLDDEITVKRLRRRGQRIVLEAENPSFAPIVVTSDRDFSIEGIVVGVLRR